MRNEVVRFTCAEDALDVGTTTAGQGPAVLFLPALSSISTREEMVPLAGYLDGQFESVCIDWPGFGTLPRPRANWSPEILSRFLSERLQATPSRPRAIVAAGHAAGYALLLNLGDEGGVACCLDIGGSDTEAVHIVSMTHLLFDRRSTMFREIDKYQRHRSKKLKQQSGREF